MAQVVLYNPAELRTPRIPMIPLALLAISTPLKKAGYMISIIDARVEKNPQQLLSESISDETICVCISALSGTPIHNALEAAKTVRSINPKIPIVWGGFHASLLPNETLKDQLVDIIVKGFGEQTIVELVCALEKKKPLEKIGGISFKKNGRLLHNPAKSFKEFDASSFMDFSLVDIKKYIKSEISGKTIDFITSRGCPHRCNFCAISKLYGKTWIPYSLKEVVQQIERLHKKHGVDGMHLLDDNFFVDKKRVEKFCDEIIKRGIKMRFWAMCRCNYFASYDSAFLQKLKQAGFDTINFGAESGSERILKKIDKDITVEAVKKTALLCKQFGFNAQFSFMMGFPFEEKQDVLSTLELMDELYKIDSGVDLKLLNYTPFPGTELFEQSIAAGFKPPANLHDWSLYNYENVTTPWLEKEKSFYNALPVLIYFAFTPTIDSKLKSMGKPIYRLFYKMLKKDALFRWNKRFFAFPLEWLLVNRFMVRKKKKEVV